ncbi:hypothetical protein L596_008774 [Steinernema carpocapsae]|uniref:Uncharacterized protein n=1 Tax=Steinernema carpocapsae TaxID=34508 RepID=A0A4U5PDL8_STECR|nr:hypothetical protein L596_008774 [Steinernema carpocapsae]
MMGYDIGFDPAGGIAVTVRLDQTALKRISGKDSFHIKLNLICDKMTPLSLDYEYPIEHRTVINVPKALKAIDAQKLALRSAKTAASETEDEVFYDNCDTKEDAKMPEQKRLKETKGYLKPKEDDRRVEACRKPMETTPAMPRYGDGKLSKNSIFHSW